jgi:transposase InsO family protein
MSTSGAEQADGQCDQPTGGLVDADATTWVDWYTSRRLPSSIGHIPPAEAEAAESRQLDE